MGLRDNSATRFEFGPKMALIRPNNPDGGEVTVSRVVSKGSGTFDFSSAADPAAVTISVKTDSAAWVDATIDLVTPAPAGGIGAVTVAELVTAITAASIPNVTAEAESGTGYLKLSLTTPGSAKYFQVKGEVAELTGMGYGYGAIIIAIDTQQTIPDEPNSVDSARLEIVDSCGKVTAVVTEGYNTGKTYAFTDTAMDDNLKAIIEGGLFVTDTEFTADRYDAPTVDNDKPILTFEYYNALYTKDDNQEANIQGYKLYRARSVSGQVLGKAGDRNLQAQPYSLIGTGYTDPLTGAKSTYEQQFRLTVSEFDALDLANLDYRS